MNLSFILEHLEEKRQEKAAALGVLLFKPDCPAVEYSDFEEYCRTENLTILQTQSHQLNRGDVIALYPKIYCDLPNDLVYGVAWKERMLDHLTSGPTRSLFLKGENVQERLMRYKRTLRDRHGKNLIPNMSEQDFLERVIKNLVHVVEDDEVQTALWILS